jgi:hypothetical protein
MLTIQVCMKYDYLALLIIIAIGTKTVRVKLSRNRLRIPHCVDQMAVRLSASQAALYSLGTILVLL